MRVPSPTADIGVFIDRLMQEKELHLLDKDLVADIRADLIARAEDKVNMAIITALPEEKLSQFNDLTEKNDLSALQQFCQDELPNLQEITATALLEFRQVYLGL